LTLLLAFLDNALVRRWEERVKMQRPEAKPRTNDLDQGRTTAIITASRKSIRTQGDPDKQ
jgi:hypothetical protein